MNKFALLFHQSDFDPKALSPSELDSLSQRWHDWVGGIAAQGKLVNIALIRWGLDYLDRSRQGDVVSSNHIEAKIACWHCVKEDSPAKWESILALYKQLRLINNSPSVALKTSLFISKNRNGPSIYSGKIDSLV